MSPHPVPVPFLCSELELSTAGKPDLFSVLAILFSPRDGYVLSPFFLVPNWSSYSYFYWLILVTNHLKPSLDRGWAGGGRIKYVF